MRSWPFLVDLELISTSNKLACLNCCMLLVAAVVNSGTLVQWRAPKAYYCCLLIDCDWLWCCWCFFSLKVRSAIQSHKPRSTRHRTDSAVQCVRVAPADSIHCDFSKAQLGTRLYWDRSGFLSVACLCCVPLLRFYLFKAECGRVICWTVSLCLRLANLNVQMMQMRSVLLSSNGFTDRTYDGPRIRVTVLVQLHPLPAPSDPNMVVVPYVRYMQTSVNVCCELLESTIVYRLHHVVYHSPVITFLNSIFLKTTALVTPKVVSLARSRRDISVIR